MTLAKLESDDHWSRARLRNFLRESLLWPAIACFLVTAIGFAWNPTPFAQVLAAIFIASAFAHAGVSYGWRQALVLLSICVAITFAIENIGAATGVPFGRYHFEVGARLPHVGRIPIIVGPLWFGAGYFSWVVASTLLDGADRRLDRPFNVIALPVVAAFVVTQWDLVIDPPTATIAKAWIWHDGGADFGVPLSNYLGWLLTAFVFFLAFAVYLRGNRSRARAAGESPQAVTPGPQTAADRHSLLCQRRSDARRAVADGTVRRRRRRRRPCLADSRSTRDDRRHHAVHDGLHRAPGNITAGDAAAGERGAVIERVAVRDGTLRHTILLCAPERTCRMGAGPKS